MSYEIFISLRYLKAKRKQAFISLITWISIGGVAVGVTALIVVISVMGGMQEDLRNKILGTNSHVVVLSNEGAMTKYGEIIKKIEGVPHVVSASPFIFNQVMLTSHSSVSGVAIRGIDPDLEAKVTDLSKRVKEGGLKLLKTPQSSELQTPNSELIEGIVIGKDLARNLAVFLGDTIDVVSPFGRATPMGTTPKVEKFRVVGIFDTGMYEYDSSLALISIPAAQRFFSMGETVTGIEIKVDDIYLADSVADKIHSMLGFPYWTRDWMEMNKNLFSALKLEKFGMFVILTLIIIVAAFNIIGTLIMMVMEKGRDIAILKSMGATDNSIMKIFIMEGLIIGIAGTIIGCIGGYVLCELLDTYHFIKLPSDVYQLDTLPVKMNPIDFLYISLSAIVISFLATIYPSWNASRLDPVEALRYE
ncbi:MAG: ABC transporter permease [Nitrospinae bacterium RIFCSPLOWO2_12_39_16]|nr:MAG: ABC transporter permease [Nitrospinae bacterium RIFCSPLOWO2_12_39_16]